jgi:hypothetical protein
MKAVVAVLAFLLLVGAAILLLYVAGLLAPLLIFLGLAAFVVLLGAIVVTGLVFLVALPYYVVAKRARVAPGAYGLDQVKEK